MKNKSKKWIYKILKISWFILGGIILLWILFWYIKMLTVKTLGVIVLAVLFASGIYLLLIYIGITILFFITRWVIKKLRKKQQ